MSVGLLAVALVAAVNPCRVQLALPRAWPAVVVGALVALAVGTAVAALGEPVLDALDVSPESFRLAAGIVLVLEGARALLRPRPAREPELAGLAAALVPVAFPLLLQPGVITLALAAGGEGLGPEAVGGLAAAFAFVLAAHAVPREERADALLLAGARLVGALEIVAGAALAVDSLLDV